MAASLTFNKSICRVHCVRYLPCFLCVYGLETTTARSILFPTRVLRNYLKSRSTCAESVSASRPQQGTGELNESEMIEPVLVITDEQGAALRQPAERPFYHPAARFAFLVFSSGGVFADATNVRNVVILRDGRVARRIVKGKRAFCTVYDDHDAEQVAIPMLTINDSIPFTYPVETKEHRMLLALQEKPNGLELTIQKHSSMERDMLILTAEVFPVINVLWIGCLIMVIGTTMAIRHRIKLARAK